MKTILILGASSDIAKEISKIYASKSFNLIFLSRNHHKLNPLVTELENKYLIKISNMELDISDIPKQKEIFNNLPEKPYGIISCIGLLKETSQISNSEDFLKVIDVNYNFIASFINLFINHYKEQKEGFIIGISSAAGDLGKRSNYAYGSAKAALNTYLSGLRSELSDYNVDVITIIPGFVYTKMTKNLKLNKFLTTSPENVALVVYRSQVRKKNIVYVKSIWRYIMLIFKLIPASIAKKLNF